MSLQRETEEKQPAERAIDPPPFERVLGVTRLGDVRDYTAADRRFQSRLRDSSGSSISRECKIKGHRGK